MQRCDHNATTVKLEIFNIQPEAYWQEQMGCLEVWQLQVDTDQEIFLETGMANGAYEIQRQGKMDFVIWKISRVARRQHWHSVCLAAGVSLLQSHLPTSSFYHCDDSSMTDQDWNMALSTTQDHCHLKHGLGGKPTQEQKSNISK